MKNFFLAFLALSFCVAQAETCLDGQDVNAIDIDISACEAIPEAPQDARLGNSSQAISLGAWELGQTAEGETYKYGYLTPAEDGARFLDYGDGQTQVDDVNLSCWSKGYYRLKQILENPPESYVKLHDAGFQYRFFQFQTDLRNGPTGFRRVSSYMDHLVKWVTLIQQDGTCVVPSYDEFDAYAQRELARRGIE